MATLQQAEDAARVDCPDAVRHALKALWADPVHRMACDFIINQLSGVGRLTFALPVEPVAMGWHAGRRFVGLQILDIVTMPIPERAETQSRHSTMTERSRRRDLTT
jgi:hypothetical protein